MLILGISAFYHDSAVALIKNGNIIFAAQEERFTRIKHDSNFPSNAISHCLKYTNIDINQIDYFCFYEKPLLKFKRLFDTYTEYFPKGFKSFKSAMPLWIKTKIFQKNIILNSLTKLGVKHDIKDKLLFTEHHISHAASAFYPSPFDKSAILTIDGVGEWATTTKGIGDKKKLNITKEIYFPHSLGLLYSAFTYYTGFKVNSGEYKLMGLAPYGEAKYVDKIMNNLLDIKDDGSFRLNLDYFSYHTGLKMTNNKFNELFGKTARKENENITQHTMDIAASIQVVLENIVLKIAKYIAKETNNKNLCMAGGVALNCVANGKIIKENIFEKIWVQPAAGDAGGALGAALYIWNKLSQEKYVPKRNKNDLMKYSYLGLDYNNKEIEKELNNLGANIEFFHEKEIIKETVKAINTGKIIGWFQGKMEFGPRALGNRSIIADPRSTKIQKELNLKIKYRESFRPFAPSVLEEYVQNWFKIKTNSPYMLLVANLKDTLLENIEEDEKKLQGFDKLKIKRSIIPAVTHVDNSARIQTVGKKQNPLFYKLLEKFNEETNCPILVNTSFNIRGEPIVCFPKDAFRCLMGTEMDMLVIGNYIIKKEKQNPNLLIDYKDKFKLD